MKKSLKTSMKANTRIHTCPAFLWNMDDVGTHQRGRKKGVVREKSSLHVSLERNASVPSMSNQHSSGAAQQTGRKSLGTCAYLALVRMTGKHLHPRVVGIGLEEGLGRPQL